MPLLVRLPALLRRPLPEAAFVGLSVAAVHALVRMSDVIAIGAFNDDGVYAALGKSLADGTGYRSVYAPGDPVHIKYPPGLPLILAVLWKLGGDLETVIRLHGLLTLAVTGTAAGLVWWLARRALALGVPLALVFGIGPFLLEGPIQYYHLVLSEPYFLALWAAALAAYAALRPRTPDRTAASIGPVVRAGLFVAGAVLFRTQGIVLIPAFVGAMLVDRASGRSIAAFCGAALVPVAAWTVIHGLIVAAGPVSLQPDEASYVSWLGVSSVGEAVRFAGRSLPFNWTWYWRGFPGNFGDTWMAGVAVVTALMGLTLVGFVTEFRRQAAPVLTVAATVGLLAVWPWPQDRFVYGFLPFAGLLAAAGLRRACSSCSRPVAIIAYASVGAIALSVMARQVDIRRAAYWRDDPRAAIGVNAPGHVLLANTKFLLSVSQWVLANTSPEDRLLVDSPAAVYLYTGRKAVNASPGERSVGLSAFDIPGQYLADRVINDGVTIVVHGSPGLTTDLLTVEQLCPGSLVVAGVAEGWTQVRVYRVVGDGSCIRDTFGQ
jgi:hypothetical protein